MRSTPVKQKLLQLRILVLSIVVSSCGVLTTSPTATEANIPIPTSWTTRLESGTDAHSWVKKFKDPLLSTLVAEVLSNNNNLQAASVRIEQLKESELITKLRQRPSVNLNTGSSVSGGIDSINDPQYNLSFNSSWEIDLWGRLKAQREQASANTAAAQADFYSACLSLAGNTTSAYFNLISAQNSLELAYTILENFEKSFRVIESNYKAGVPGVDALDVQFGRNNVTSAERGVVSAKLNVEQTSQTLQILLGRYPDGSLRANKELPVPLTSFPNTLPAGIVEQRPDLIAARADLLSSLKEVEIRQKNLLPTIGLNGGANTNNSVSLLRLLDPSFLSWNIAASIAHELYDGGEEKALVRQALALYEADIKDYTQDVLVAFNEIEFAQKAETSLTEQTRLLREEVRVTALAEKQAQRDYSSGLESVRILTVLEAQRRANNASSDLINIRNQRLQNQIDLFVAIGGNP